MSTKNKSVTLNGEQLAQLLKKVSKAIQDTQNDYEVKLPKAYEALGKTLAENKFDVTLDASNTAIEEIKKIKAQISCLEDAWDAADSEIKNILKEFCY
jgi:hypothetical protein